MAVIVPKTTAEESGEGALPLRRIKIIIQIITIYIKIIILKQ